MPLSRVEKIKRLKKAVKKRAIDNRPVKLKTPFQKANPIKKAITKRLAKTKIKKKKKLTQRESILLRG